MGDDASISVKSWIATARNISLPASSDSIQFKRLLHKLALAILQVRDGVNSYCTDYNEGYEYVRVIDVIAN